MQFPLQLWVGGSGEAIVSWRSVQKAKFWAMWNFALRINPPVMDLKSPCVILQLSWRGGEQLWMSHVKWSPWRKKPQLMTGRRAFRGNWVTRKWTENLREMYWHRKCLPYIFFAALPFLSFVVFFSLKPWTTFYLWEGIMVAWSWKELRALCSCKLCLWGLPGVKLCTVN